MSDTHADPLAKGVAVSFHWSPVVAGALAAAALGFVLHAFAIAIGISVSSTAPTWRDTSFALVLLSGLYLLLAALISYGFGGYVAARLRARHAVAPTEDVEFRDGVHGLITWALATLLTGLVVLWTIQAMPRQAQPSANSVAGENMIAFDLDRLFRGERRPSGDIAYARAEAARILLTTASHDGVQVDDHSYLVRLVAATTGLAPADAEKRVMVVSGSAKSNIDRARRSGVLLGFMTGAAALLGAAAAWFAAVSGGRHRDGHDTIPSYLDWGRPYTRSR